MDKMQNSETGIETSYRSKINDYSTGEYQIIYIYSLPDVTTHIGDLKIGKASISASTYTNTPKEERDKLLKHEVKKRIKEQVGTPDLNYQLEFYALGIANDGGSFMDYAVHKVLQRSGFEKVHHTKDKKSGGEWFHISLATAISAFKAVQEGRQSLDSNKIVTNDENIVFRKGSQTDAIDKTIKAIKKGKKHFLWDAKMRFGKTLSAMEVAKRMNYGKVLIITHRPEVNEDWFSDFNLLFKNTDYHYGSRERGLDILTLQDQYLEKSNGEHANPFIYFASIQYLRHKVQPFEKRAIIEESWDMLIVDEADEGIKTALSDEIISQIKRKFTLMLSGTPFNLLEDYDSDEIYSWDYTKEQELKAKWHELYPDEPNPYYKLPKLSIYTYELNKYLETEQFKNLYDKAFNFKEFFQTDKDGNFVYEKYIKKFLDLLVKPSMSNFPYSTPTFYNNLRHTLWMVPGVKEAKALSKLLDQHPLFGYKDENGKRLFNIANIAGDGDEEVVERESRKIVYKAITKHPDNAHSITIS